MKRISETPPLEASKLPVSSPKLREIFLTPIEQLAKIAPPLQNTDKSTSAIQEKVISPLPHTAVSSKKPTHNHVIVDN